MQPLLLLSSLLVSIWLFASWICSRPRGARFTPLANIAEGFAPSTKTYLADAAISTRFLVGKIGTDASHVALAGVSDIPLGIIADEAAAAEDAVMVRLLGVQNEGGIAIASAAITAGDLLVPAANGKVRTLPGTSGTYYILGRAIKAAGADGDQVEFVPSFPMQRVVP
ncbi:MAG: capsid cement protein [Verrucomicrobiota bacterium]